MCRGGGVQYRLSMVVSLMLEVTWLVGGEMNEWYCLSDEAFSFIGGRVEKSERGKDRGVLAEENRGREE